MPPKTVVCVICGETVLKSQTLARVDKSRACRSHPGIESESETLQKAEKTERMKSMNKKPSFKTREFSSVDYNQYMESMKKRAKENRNYMYKHCWTCGCEGRISLREHFAQCLVAMRRLEMRGEFDFLSLPQNMAKIMGPKNVLAILPYDANKDQKIRDNVQRSMLKEFIGLLGFMNLCVKCIDFFEVRDRLEAMIPKPSMEQITAMSSVMEVINPVIDDLAIAAEMKENK